MPFADFSVEARKDPRIGGQSQSLRLARLQFLAFWAAFFDAYREHWFWVALTVELALIAIVLWGTLAGSMLPFVTRGWVSIRQLLRCRLSRRW
jgi:hypothetical protein